MNKIALIMLIIMGFSPSVLADWELLNSESTIHYVSIKKSKIGEVGSFNNLTGSINEEGKVALSINLASIETDIAIRNERMKTMLFEIEKFAQAKISGSVDLRAVSSLKPGDTYTASTTLILSLHGVSKEISSDAQITMLSHKRLLVTSLKPLVISAEDFNLAEGVEKLRSVADLPVISTAVPVTYKLVFKR